MAGSAMDMPGGMAVAEHVLLVAAKIAVAALFFMWLERQRPAEPTRPYFNSSFKTESLFTATNNFILFPLFAVGLTWIFVSLAGTFIPYQALDDEIQALNPALQIFLGMLIIDFGTYWRHRFSHAFMWPFHAVHHSAEGLSWQTKNRLHPVDLLLAVGVNVAVLHVIGFGGPWIMFSVVLLEIIDYWAHSNFNCEFRGPLRYLLVCPNYHRWHHASDREGHDKNFVIAFPFIDRLFGTYYFPPGRLPASYGLTPREQAHVRQSYRGLLALPFEQIGLKKKPRDPIAGSD